MTALKILGVILLVFLALGFLRLGAVATFGDALRVRLRVGALKLTVYPRKAKKPKREKPAEKEEAKEEKPKKKRNLPKPTLDDALDLLQTAFSALGATARRACRRLCVDPLELTVVFGGGDPASVAEAFGAANALLYTVMPRAEETFDIPAPSLHLRVDFEREQTEARGTLGVSLRLCDLFAIVFTLAVPLLRWFLRFKKAHRRDRPPLPAESSAESAAEKQPA